MKHLFFVALLVAGLAQAQSRVEVTIGKDASVYTMHDSTGPIHISAGKTDVVVIWQTVAAENEKIFAAGPQTFRFGANGQWSVKQITGASTCSNAVFGDPIYGVVKACQLMSLDGTTTDHHGGMQGIDFSQLPVPWPGVSVPMLSPAPADGSGVPPLADGKNEGAVRTMCTWSHMAFDDPIVYPGQPGVAHSHTFFGNNGIDAFTTPENIRSKGTANCRGGTVNLSGYWVPSMVDDTNHAVAPLYIVTYYKTGWQPWLQGNVPPMVLPKGLRMVVGDARATPAAPQVGENGLGPHVAFSCTDATDNALTPYSTFIPAECKTGQTLRLRVDFKQCWNGQLDSPDHKSHVADPVYVNDGVVPAGFQCPTTHQVGLLPVISYLIRWPLTGDPSKYHIASDMYTGGPGGYSAHGDWMNGWDETISSVWVENCMKTRRDCGSFNLGDGRGGIEFGGN